MYTYFVVNIHGVCIIVDKTRAVLRSKITQNKAAVKGLNFVVKFPSDRVTTLLLQCKTQYLNYLSCFYRQVKFSNGHSAISSTLSVLVHVGDFVI